MKERPILFSGAMVRAILSGQKTQTRRAMNPQPELQSAFVGGVTRKTWVYKNTADPEGWLMHKMCPYGQPGDRLWVRESWSADFANYYPHDRCWYRASDERKHDIEVRDGVRGIFSPESNEFVTFRWRPSIHMPRWACRIVLEIVSVRVERLNDISEADALEEGITYNDIPNNGLDPMRARTWFRGLWSEINGPESWQANPWVWVVEFKGAGMKVTNAELAAVYRAEAAHTKHKKWAETLLMWAERLEPSQIDLFGSEK